MLLRGACMKFTKELILELAQTCNVPTGDPVLDKLFDDYDEASAHDDIAVYYRFLYQLSKKHPGLSFVELGTKYGAASLHFLKGGGGSAVAVDCGDRVRHELFKGLPFKFVHCRSLDPLAVAAAGTPDIVMIDTDHSYNTTVGEFDVWSKVVRPGGVILFDDIGAYRAYGREDFGCGKFFEELEGDKINLPMLHPEHWGFGCWFKPES